MSFTGGKLKLKGSSSSEGGGKKKKKRKVVEGNEEESGLKTSSSSSSSTEAVKSTELKPEDYLTASELRHLKKKQEVDTRNAKEIVKSTYRERVENFNVSLASETEYNDIPRTSAAGNG